MAAKRTPSRPFLRLMALGTYSGLVLALFFGMLFIPIGLLEATTSPLFAFIYVAAGFYVAYRAANCARDLRARKLDLEVMLASWFDLSRNDLRLFALLCVIAVVFFLALSIIPYPVALVLLWPSMLVESFAYKAGVFIEFGLRVRPLAPITNMIFIAAEAYYLTYLAKFLLWLRGRYVVEARPSK